MCIRQSKWQRSLPINLDALAEWMAEEFDTEGDKPLKVIPVDDTNLAHDHKQHYIHRSEYRKVRS